MTWRRSVAVLLLAIGAFGLVWGARRVDEARRFLDGVERARHDVGSGRFEEARRWLDALPERRKSDPEVFDLIAVCEHAAGRYDAALAAWAMIPAKSPLAGKVALARARTLIGDLGRYADAEPILEAALRERGPTRLDVRHTLSQLYFTESRPEPMRRVLEDGWQEWRDPAAEVRHLWLIDDAPVEVGPVRKVVGEAAAKAPDDDRVWLAQTGLDRLEGRLDEARGRLDRCTQRRPDDPAVWLARLRLARTADDPAEAARALEHIPADALREADWLDLRGWLAGRRGDAAEHRRTLEERIKIGPADPAAFERLAVVCHEAGEAARAAELRRHKAELDRAKDRYRRLLAESTPTEGFAELAALAEALGRPFEAYNWWELAARRDPSGSEATAALARLASHRTPDRPPARTGTLADRLAGPRASTAAAPAPPPNRSTVPRFRDDAEAAGLRFTFDNGESPLRQLPETTAGGVGLLDYDGDGRLDVYLVQGGPFPPRGETPTTGDRLFRNRGDGTFEDASESSGIARMPRGYGHGVAVGDVDNDGHPDLFITRWSSYALYRNRGDGTFEDITSRAGLAGDRGWPTSAAFADLDNDGDLDLYVCHYLRWDAEHPPLCAKQSGGGVGGSPMLRYDYCMPHPFPSEPDHLYRNDGGRFVDVTAEAGIVDADGRGLGVVAVDVDEDGLVDLFVANDTTANYLFRNRGGMRFEEVGSLAGVACNADGAFQAGMGVAAGDVDGDGRVDLCVTNFYGESVTYYQNIGGGIFADRTGAVGLAAASRYLLGFGIVLFDANDDGRLDLATANGHVVDDRPKAPLEMPCQLLVNGPDGRLVDVSRDAGPPWSVPRIGRALASGDLDGDGRLDLIVVSQRTPLAFFHNQSEAGHSLTLRLEGTKSNRDGVGAVVTARVDGRTLRAWRTGGGSFQSASDGRIHLGLGGSTRADSIEVRWPSGRVDKHAGLAAGRTHIIREGDANPVP